MTLTFAQMVENYGENTTVSLLVHATHQYSGVFASLDAEEWLRLWRESVSRGSSHEFHERLLRQLSLREVGFLLACLEDLNRSCQNLGAAHFNRLSEHVAAGCSQEDFDRIVAFALNRELHHGSSEDDQAAYAILKEQARVRLCNSDDVPVLLTVCTDGYWCSSGAGLFSSSTWSPKYPDEIVKPAVFKAIRLCVESDAANPESPTPLAVWFSLISGGARHLEGEHSSPARRFPEIVPVVVEHILAQHQDHPIDEMMCLMHMCIRALHGPAAKLVAEHLVGRLPEWGFGQLLREISYTEEGGALSIGYLCEELNARMRESKLFCESVEGVPVDVADTRVLHARVFREALKRATTPGDFHALLKALDDSLPNNKKRLRTMRRQVLKKLLVVGLVGCEIDDGLAIMREAAVFRDLKTSVFQLLKELPWANGPESQLRQRVLEAEDPLSDFRQPTHRLERMVWEEILAEAHPLAWWLELVRINRWYLTRDLQTRLWGKVEGCAQSDDEKSALLTLLEKPYGKNGRKGRNPSHGSFAKSRQEEALRLRLRVWRAGRFAAVQECVAEMNTRDYSSPIYTAAKQRLDMLLEVTASAATLV